MPLSHCISVTRDIGTMVIFAIRTFSYLCSQHHLVKGDCCMISNKLIHGHVREHSMLDLNYQKRYFKLSSDAHKVRVCYNVSTKTIIHHFIYEPIAKHILHLSLRVVSY